MGSSQAQYHLRRVCVYTNMHPLNKPEVFAHALRDNFGEDGNLVDARISRLIRDQMGHWRRGPAC